MLISAAKLERYWGVHPDRILHIGAHEAEELAEYQRLGWGTVRVVWVEAMPASVAFLRERLKGLSHHELIDAVAWNVTGDTISFSVASNGESSSALALKDHLVEYPHIVVVQTLTLTTTALAEVVDFDGLGSVDLVNLDIQGAELRALQGIESQLWRVRAIYSEINKRELYEGCALLPEMDVWLRARGFVRVDWELMPTGWGDGLWLRESELPHFVRARRWIRWLSDSGPRLNAFARRIARRARGR